MRNSDGRFRNHNKPTAISVDTLRAQWVETEAMRLKRTGFSFAAIAEQLMQVGRGQKVAVTPLPEGISFPPDYKITAMGCHKAVRRALRRAPTLQADEMRRFDTERCEEMYLFLTPGIRQGDPQSVKAAVSVLAHKAAINNYKSAETEIKFKVAPGPSWSPVLPKDSFQLEPFKEAVMALLEAGVKAEELGDISGLGLPSVEVTARKLDGDENT